MVRSRPNCSINSSIGSLTSARDNVLYNNIVMHGNVQCLRNKVGRLEIALQSSSPDILCLSEHWLKSSELNSTTIEGYKLVNAYCRVSSKNGGVIIYAKLGTVTSPFHNISKISIEKHFEYTAIEYECSVGKIIIVCIYRSPCGNFNLLINGLTELLHQLSKLKTYIVICGDFNINFIGNTSDSSILVDLFRSHGMESHVNEPTRITALSSTCIDNIFSNLSSICSMTKVIDLMISDHCFLLLSLPFQKPKLLTTGTFYSKRYFTTRQIDLFVFKMSGVCWDSIYNLKSVDDMFDQFMKLFLKVFDEAFPIETKKVSPKTPSSNNNWFTTELKKLSNLVKTSYSTLKNNNCELNKINYLKIKREYRSAIEAAKRGENDNLLKNASNKTKVAWNIVNKNQNKKIGPTRVDISIEDDQNNIITSAKDVANQFNKYFGNIVKNLLDSRHMINNNNTFTISNCNSNRLIDKCIFLSPLTAKEYYDIINVVCKKKSSGMDNIPCNILKYVSSFIFLPLSFIINSSFVQGCFPTSLKKSKIIPLHKNGDRKKVSNYRPISLLSVFSKIFEKAFCSRIIAFINHHALLNKCQHGFTKNRSTATAIAGFINDILLALNNKEKVLGVFYDFSKAFDTVDHGLLLSKLNNLGISGVANDWIKSYLSNRKQFVFINDSENNYSYSEEVIINVGMPQGSNIAPLLFILFTNDLPRQIQKGRLTLFADDTTHFLSSSINESLIKKTNTAVHEIENWCLENHLFLNKNKSVFLRFDIHSNSISDSSPLIRLEGKSIEENSETKFLGLIIDNRLDWGAHITALCNRVAAGCYLLKKLMENTNFEVVKMVYYAHIQSLLQYGIIIWGASSHTKKLFILQKRALRFMANASFNPCADIFYKDSCSTIFKKFKILTLPCIYIYSCIMYIIDNRSFVATNDSVHNYNTRIKTDIRLDFYKNNSYFKDPIHMGSKFFNILPPHVKNTRGIKFKTSLKSFLIQNCFYSVRDFLLLKGK